MPPTVMASAVTPSSGLSGPFTPAPPGVEGVGAAAAVGPDGARVVCVVFPAAAALFAPAAVRPAGPEAAVAAPLPAPAVEPAAAALPPEVPPAVAPVSAGAPVSA